MVMVVGRNDGYKHDGIEMVGRGRMPVWGGWRRRIKPLGFVNREYSRCLPCSWSFRVTRAEPLQTSKAQWCGPFAVVQFAPVLSHFPKSNTKPHYWGSIQIQGLGDAWTNRGHSRHRKSRSKRTAAAAMNLQ